ncbi:MAG TPA: serine/threonine-protein kinase [Solirubrobacterales bacterium]|nr:serine/threonine-protein kinase [Solirubrobacterales bacterium]
MIEPGGWIDLASGDQFAGYRIERRLGRGGMGILYLATEPGLERRVALKLIAPEAAADEVFAKRFAEESRIAASIEHPNVVPIYAAGDEDGVPYIAMRFVAGSDLGRRIESEGRLDPERAAALIAQVGNGLDAIHAAGLVHRDVKPANVLLSGEPGSEHAYITDFGVARNVATQSGLTQTGRFVGTLDYVAPEQISGAAVDARVDVYALGCLLFKLLTGQVPFPREGEAARLYAHLNDPPPAPSLYAPGTSMALDDVVARAMAKEPGDRYPSAGDLGRAALAAVSGESISIPERTVATGAAATVEPETIAPLAPTAETEPGPTDASGDGGGGGSRRVWALAGGGLAVVAAVVLAIVLSSGGGGDGGQTGAEGTGLAQTEGGDGTGSTTAKEEKKQVETPQTLTAAQLIKEGDQICENSQDTFKAVREAFPEARSEEVPNVEYSEELVKISTRAVNEFQRLVPPPKKADAYRRYVTSQEEVNELDEKALTAAEAENTSSYLLAREARNEGQPLRHEIADEIGFKVCSASES